MQRPLSFAIALGFSLLPLGRAQTPLVSRGGEYVLRAGDNVEVSYTYTPEYNQTVTIPADGAVGLMRLGPVTIGGLSISAATNTIADAGSRSGLNKPAVVLTLRDFVRPQFTVLGEVAKPGKFEIHGTIRVADALAMASGLTKDGRHKNIILIHRINDTLGQTTLINYKTLEKPNAEIALETITDGDIIVVPTSNFAKVERIVKVLNLGVFYSPNF